MLALKRGLHIRDLSPEMNQNYISVEVKSILNLWNAWYRCVVLYLPKLNVKRTL
jgi:hypothetical protein